MAFDPDLVRVDLMRIKRKIYISYPEGSKERKDFLLAFKLNELAYLQKLLDPVMVDLAFEEYNRQLKNEVINFGLCLVLGLCFTFMFLPYHQLHSTNLWLNFWCMPAVIGVLWASTHVYHAVKLWRQFKPFRREYNVIRRKIEKLGNEIGKFQQ